MDNARSEKLGRTRKLDKEKVERRLQTQARLEEIRKEQEEKEKATALEAPVIEPDVEP